MTFEEIQEERKLAHKNHKTSTEAFCAEVDKMTDDLSDELYEFHKTRAAFFEKTMLAARARLAELREKETTVLFGEKCDYQSDA